MNGVIPIDPVALPLTGAVDGELRLVAADGPLYALQAAAGARLGDRIAVPQLAAVAREALKHDRTLRRAIIAASEAEDLELRIEVRPDGDGGAVITIEDWQARPRGLARFTAREASDIELDTRLRMTRLDRAVARRFDVDLSSLPRPFTDFVTLRPRRDGTFPLLDAFSTGRPFDKQNATVKSHDFDFAFSGAPVTDDEGELRGFALSILHLPDAARTPDEGFDETLRSPLTRIISAADQIVDRSDGPLRSDYANYAGDIATAGRHLLSVIRSMSAAAPAKAEEVDLAALAREAASMVSADARAVGVDLELEQTNEPLTALGEPRGILQVLVNIMGNAIRHSPVGGTVAVVFDEIDGQAAVTIADQGPGIDRPNQGRIFEEYERLGRSDDDHAGLGLAISRRLARSMQGDIVLDSAKGEGARFTLKLPRP